MWMLFARAPAPDRPYWTGRRFLAAVDALAWPSFFLLLIAQAPGASSVFKPVIGALALLAMWHRLYVAWWRNHRYRFTTWRWGRVLSALLVIGVVLKIVLAI